MTPLAGGLKRPLGRGVPIFGEDKIFTSLGQDHLAGALRISPSNCGVATGIACALAEIPLVSTLGRGAPHSTMFSYAIAGSLCRLSQRATGPFGAK